MKTKIVVIASIALLALFACKNKHAAHQTTGEYYTCSMHPQVMEKKPGKCPICQMELIKVLGIKDSTGLIKYSAAQMKLANIKVDTARLTNISEGINVAAKINLNQSENISLSSRVAGRVEKLYFKNAGEYIKQGDLLYEIYSEELAAAQREYLIAQKQSSQMKETEINLTGLAEGAKNKLLLWGMTEAQISQMAQTGKATTLTSVYSAGNGVITEVNIREGDYISQGGTIYKLNTMQTVWVEAQLYAAENGKVHEGENYSIRVFDYPDKMFNAKITFISPEISSQSKILPVRLELSNPGYLFKPGMAATVFIQSKNKKALALPIEAVLQNSSGSVVWIQKPDCSFESRMVKTGISNSRYIEVTEGLKEGDVVVISGAYLIQSDYQFKKGASPMEGMKM